MQGIAKQLLQIHRVESSKLPPDARNGCGGGLGTTPLVQHHTEGVKGRSEERRVGKECRSRRLPCQGKKTKRRRRRSRGSLALSWPRRSSWRAGHTACGG